MWMTREEIAEELGIVVNSVRGKVKKGQIERKVVDGKHLYRVANAEAAYAAKPEKEAPPPRQEPHVQEPRRSQPDSSQTFNPKAVLLDMLASMKVDRNIEAIEKGDEIDLATDELSRELDARISMRQHKQIKEIEDALERVKLGEYGECEDCGDPIPEARLKLFPAARLCVRCQEEADRQERLRDENHLRAGNWRDDSADSGYIKSFED